MERVILSNRIIRNYLHLFSEHKWVDVIKTTLLYGIQNLYQNYDATSLSPSKLESILQEHHLKLLQQSEQDKILRSQEREKMKQSTIENETNNRVDSQRKESQRRDSKDDLFGSNSKVNPLDDQTSVHPAWFSHHSSIPPVEPEKLTLLPPSSPRRFQKPDTAKSTETVEKRKVKPKSNLTSAINPLTPQNSDDQNSQSGNRPPHKHRTIQIHYTQAPSKIESKLKEQIVADKKHFQSNFPHHHSQQMKSQQFVQPHVIPPLKIAEDFLHNPYMVNHFVSQSSSQQAVRSDRSSNNSSRSSQRSNRSNRSHHSYIRESSHTPATNSSDLEWVTPEIEEQQHAPVHFSQSQQKNYQREQTTQNTRLQYQAGEWELETVPSDNDIIDRQTATDNEYEGDGDDEPTNIINTSTNNSNINNNTNNNNNNNNNNLNTNNLATWTDFGPDMERGLEAIKYSTMDIARRLRQAEQERKALEQQLLMT